MNAPDPATPAPAPERQRDALFATGMTTVGLAAAISSYSGLASLADLAGWNHRLALLLPLTIDAYAMTATRVWLSPKTAGAKARRWAKGNAIGAIATSVAGNGVAHAASAHVFHVAWPVVVAVSAIPSIVLGLITHLWHLRNTPDPTPVPAAAPEPPAQDTPVPATGTGSQSPTGTPVPGASGTGTGRAPRKSTGTPRRATAKTQTDKAPARTDEELLDEGRLLAAELGSAPSATRLKKTLRTGPDRARRLAAILAAEQVPTDTTTAQSV
jgi:hypothetical protein